MCRQGCSAIQINEQGREFVNKVSDELYLLTGVHQWLASVYLVNGCFAIQINEKSREFFKEVSDEFHLLTFVQQRVTSAYHPLSNGLVKRQNRTIKNVLVNIKLSSTKYFPFKLLYNREPVLLTDYKYRL